jgi:carboxymethylenebutenolidase
VLEGMLAETIGIAGHNGDIIQAYYARPIAATAAPGVIVLHHMPGWDEWSKEVTRKFAHHGYAAICPHLFSRHGPGRWDDVAAAARAAGGPSDAQVVGDAAGAAAFLRAQPGSSGRVGAIGFCSGGRQAYLLACRLPSLDAAVDCWGGRVIARPEELTEARPVAVIDMTKDMHCPLLGIFGNDDANPDVEQVNRTEEELKKHGKVYEFHRYDGAGHGFFAVDRPAYRQEQAVDGWKKVFAFYERHLQPESAAGGADSDR